MVTDQVAVLLNMNNSLARLTSQLDRLAVSSSSLHKVFTETTTDLGQKLVHRHFLLDTLLPQARGGWGGGGGGGGGPGGPGGGFVPPAATSPFAGTLLSNFMRPYDKGSVSPELALKMHQLLSGKGDMSDLDFNALSYDLANVFKVKGTGENQTAERVFTDEYLEQLNELHKMGRLSAQEQARAQKENTKEVSKLSEGVRAFVDKLDGLGRRVLLGGMSAADAGAPDAFATLSGSWKLLLAVVGKETVPALVRFSSWLQRAAKSFESMDPALRGFVGSAVAYGSAVAAAALAIRATGLGGLAGGAASALGRTAFGAGLLGAVASPRGGAVSGGAAAGAGLALGWGMYMSDQFRQAELRGDAGVAEAAQGASRWRDSHDPIIQKALKEFAAGNKQGAALILRAGMMGAEERMKKDDTALGHLRGLHGPDGQPYSRARSAFEQLLGDATGLLSSRADIAATERSRNEHLYQLEQRRAAYQGLIRPETRGTKAVRDQATVAGQGLLMDILGRTQPGYFGVEDIYKKIQLEALNRSPLEEEIRRIQMESLQELMRHSSILERIANENGIPSARAR